MNLKTGHLLKRGDYRVEKVLGEGGFGITYLCEQTGLLRKVAIKEFFMREYCEREHDTASITLGSSGSREMVERFRRKFIKEARAIATFGFDNKHIVRIIDVFEENNTAYYVMEYVGGGSLSDKVKDGALPEADALRYIRQVATALEFVHGKHMMHLDIKPSNILLNENDDTVLIDFGLAKQYDDAGTQTSTTPVGISHGYAPLEQYKQGGVGTFSPATDIYSLGATLYKLVTGKTPPEAGDVNDDGLPALPKEISSTTCRAIETAMQPRRKDRPQSIGEFLALLDGKMKDERAKSADESDGATVVGGSVMNNEILRSTQNDKEQKPVISTERSDGEISSTDAGETVLLTDDKLSPCSMWTSNEVLAVELDGKWGFEDPTGKFVIPCKYDWADDFFEGLAAVKLDGKYGFVDPTGKLVIPCKYDDAYSFSEGLAAVELDGKYGFVDPTGKLVIPCKYYWADSFFEGLAAVKLDGKYGFVDPTGKFVIPCKYDDACSFSGGLAAVELDGKYGFVDPTGKLVIPCKYDWALEFSEGLAEVELDGKYGFVDPTGKFVIPCKYDWALGFSEGLAAVELDGEYGFVDPTGKLVIPCKYDNAFGFSEGLAAVKLDDKWGFIDPTGKLVIPCKYDWAVDFSKGLAAVELDGVSFCIDKNGKEYITSE